MEMVNGFPCRDCADVALAKRNIDPAKHQPGVPDAPAGRADKDADKIRAASAPAIDPNRALDLVV